MFNIKRSLSEPNDINIVLKSNEDKGNLTTTSTNDETLSSKIDIKPSSYVIQLENQVKRFKLNNNWNTRIENIVKQLGEQAAGYQWMHANAASFWSFTSLIVTFAITILGSIVSFLLSSSIIAQLKTPWVYIFIGLSTVLSILLTVLTVALKILNLESRSTKHQEAAKNFSNFYVDIVIEMSKFRREREDAIKYVRQIHREFLFYEIASPDIPGLINWRYGKKVKEKGLATVGEIGDAIHIQTGDLISEISNKKKNKRKKKRKRADMENMTFKHEQNVPSLKKQQTLYNGTMIEKLRNVLQQKEVSSESECESNNDKDDIDIEKGLKENDPHVQYQIDRYAKEI